MYSHIHKQHRQYFCAEKMSTVETEKEFTITDVAKESEEQDDLRQIMDQVLL